MKSHLEQAREAMKDQIVGPDGIARHPKQQDVINQSLASCFSGEKGGIALDYLKSITVSMVVPPEAGDAVLRHREGMRDLFRIINARINDPVKYGETDE